MCAAAWLLLCAIVGIVAIEGALHPGRRTYSRIRRERRELDPNQFAMGTAVSESELLEFE